MLELWINGRLSGYWKAPNGYTPREWAAHYNERQRYRYSNTGLTMRMIPL